MLLALAGGSSALAQSAASPYPTAGAEFGAYFAGEEFTSGLGSRHAYPTGSLFFEMPVYGNLGFNLAVVAGTSRGLVSNIAELKGVKEVPFDQYAYNTTYAGAMFSPALFLPDLLGDFGAILSLRTGWMFKKTLTYRDDKLSNDDWLSFLAFGAGLTVTYPVSDNLTLRASAIGHLTNSDMLDGYALGNHNDGFSTFSVGFSWRFIDAEQVIIAPSDYFSQRFSSGQLPPIRSTLTTSSVRVRQFSSFDDLRRDPSLMMLYLTRKGAGKLPMQVQVEVLHAGRRVAWSNRVVTISGEGRYEVLHARQFMDLDNLVLAENYEGKLPTGKYDVQVTVLPASQGLTFNARSTFQNINLDEYFGDDRASIEAMIESNQITVATTDDSKLVISMFDNATSGDPGEGAVSYGTPIAHTGAGIVQTGDPDSPPSSMEAGRTPGRLPNPNRQLSADAQRISTEIRTTDADRISSENRTVDADRSADMNGVAALRGRHDGVGDGTRATATDSNRSTGDPSAVRTLSAAEWEGASADSAELMEESIQQREASRRVVTLVPEGAGAPAVALQKRTEQAFSTAMTLMHTLKPKARTSTVIAVVYFPMNGSVISEEGRITLDYVARQVRAHPNLRLELRGYAVEYADRVVNERLSEQRAQRVYDYLVRRIVPTSLIRGVRLNPLSPDEGGHRPALLRKVEIALVEDDPNAPAQRPLIFERQTD